MSKGGADYNERKHTNLDDEIEMHRPDTSWHRTLVAVVILITLGFLCFAVHNVIEVLNTPIYAS